MTAIRVLLVDDQALFRQGMRALMEAEPDLDIVGEAGDGAECLRQIHGLRPDVILMDLRMPRMDGVEAITRVSRQFPDVRVVALTTFDDDELVFRALAEGALSYLLKDAEPEQIASAIRGAAAGKSMLAPAKVVHEFARMTRGRVFGEAESLGLSNRETDVLRELSRGASNKEIARVLGLAEGTVKNHLTHIFDKLGVEDRTHAALIARERGIT